MRPDGQELIDTDNLLADKAAALQAVFRLNASGFSLLLAKTNSNRIGIAL